MATRIINIKLPGSKRVPSKRRAADAVVPGVKGLRTIRPSVIGIAERADLIRSGVTMLQTARAVAAKTGDAELAALANSPKLNKALDAAIKRLGRQADSILREQNAASNDDPEDLDHTGTANAPTEGDPKAITGMDAAQVTRIRHARFSMAADQAAALGAYNPARVALGLPDEVPDDVYAFMGDVSKASK